jgi:Spy/CpxP family protein refolding chaperone
MKKLLVLVALFTTVYVSQANAQGQGGGDPAERAAKMKEMVKPKLIEKTKLTDAEAEKVLDISIKYRQQMRGLRDLSEEDRKKKLEEIQTAQTADYKAIPLTNEQIKAVNEFFEEQRKAMQQNRPNGGN